MDADPARRAVASTPSTRDRGDPERQPARAGAHRARHRDWRHHRPDPRLPGRAVPAGPGWWVRRAARDRTGRIRLRRPGGMRGPVRLVGCNATAGASSRRPLALERPVRPRPGSAAASSQHSRRRHILRQVRRAAAAGCWRTAVRGSVSTRRACRLPASRRPRTSPSRASRSTPRTLAGRRACSPSTHPTGVSEVAAVRPSGDLGPPARSRSAWSPWRSPRVPRARCGW